MPGEPDLSDLVGQLREDTVRVVRAEVEVRRARLVRAKNAIQRGAIFGVAAALIGIVALVGLEVGLILALATLIGPLGATLVVVGVTALVAAILARIAVASFRRTGGGA